MATPASVMWLESEGSRGNVWSMSTSDDETSSSAILDYIKRGPSPEERRYWQSLLHEDDLGAVVRTSTFLESYFVRILSRHFLNPTAKVDIRGIAYMRRVELAWALGEIDEDLVNALRCLDNLRGRFAHNHTYELDAKSLHELLGTLDGHALLVYEHNMEFTFAANTAEVRYENGSLSESKRQLRAALDAIRTVIGMIARSAFDLGEHVRDGLAKRDAERV
jgi:hypothetical protein